MNNKILVTGSNGLLGQKLTDLIQQQEGFELIATGRGKNRNPHLTSTYIELNIGHLEEVEKVIESTQPNIIINTAAMTNVDACEENQEECWEANVTAVKNLIQVCEVHSIFLIHVSTDFIFDGLNGPYTEVDKANPVSYYGESKLKAEEFILQSSLDWAIARTVLVYGIVADMSRSNIILWVKNSLEEGKEIQVVNDQWRTPTLAEDLAMGCFLIAKNKAKGIYNISGDELLTPYEIALRTANYFQLDKNLIKETDGSKFQQKAKRPPKTGFILDKAKKTLNYHPHTFEEGIQIMNDQIKAS